MDFWMFDRRTLKNDLLDLFSALGDLQYRYDWVISDHDIWYAESCPDAVRKRWQWTGLLMDGAELTEHLRSGYVSLSAAAAFCPLFQRGRSNHRLTGLRPIGNIKASFPPDTSFRRR